MHAAASADWRTPNRRATGGTATLGLGPPVGLRSLWHTGPPTVVGLPENVFSSARGAGRPGQRRGVTTGHRPETNWRRSQETPLGTGPNPSRRTGGRPPAVPAPTPGVGR
jgi:hypothetical protein